MVKCSILYWQEQKLLWYNTEVKHLVVLFYSKLRAEVRDMPKGLMFPLKYRLRRRPYQCL